MKYSISKFMVEHNELGYLTQNHYKILLDFILCKSDMISLCTNSTPRYIKVIEQNAPEILFNLIEVERTNSTPVVETNLEIPVCYFKFGENIISYLYNKQSLFDYVKFKNNWLDDVAFYRKGTCWLSTSTHEKLVLIDINYYKQYNLTSGVNLI